MALQEFRDPTDQTRYGYDAGTGQAIAFSTPESRGQYFNTPFNDAPVASFDTTGAKSSPDKLVPVISSGPARQAVSNGSATILSNEQGGNNPALARTQEQINQSIQNIQGNGLGLSPEEQRMLNQLGTLSNQETASLAAGRSAIDASDPRGILGSANSYTQYQQQRSQILQRLLEQMNNRQSDINTITNLLGPSTTEQETSKQLTDTKAKLRDFDVNTMKGQFALEDEPIPMPIIGKQQLQLERQRTFERMGLSNQAMALTEILNSEVASRQMKLEATKFLFDAKRQEMSDALSLYKELAPENISTQVDEYTGQMTVIMRNPVTGETYRENLGQVGTPRKWVENVEYAKENQVTKPFYMRDGRTVINANTGREYETLEQYLADGGVKNFSNVQVIEPQQEVKLLSVTEAARLGVPYGTTEQEAAALARTPSFGKASSGRSASTSKTSTKASSSTSSLGDKVSKAKVEDYIKFVISDSGGVSDQNRYELWGQIADEMKTNKINPTQYDELLWKYFHPEGTAGYKKYVLGQGSETKEPWE